jgi:hypothetical protein
MVVSLMPRTTRRLATSPPPWGNSVHLAGPAARAAAASPRARAATQGMKERPADADRAR